MSTVGQNIREARRRAGLRTEALAGRIGYSVSAIETYERGKIIPKIDVIEAIAAALNVPPWELCGWDAPKPKPEPEARIYRAARTAFKARVQGECRAAGSYRAIFAGDDRAAALTGGETMPKEKVNRTPDYKLRVRIRGEIDAQGVPISKACEYAGVSVRTFYRLLKEPMRYFPETLELMRNLSIPIEDVRGMIQYPW